MLRKFKPFFSFICSICLLSVSTSVFAGMEGFHDLVQASLSTWQTKVAIILLVLLFLYSWYTIIILLRKNAQAKSEIKKLGKHSDIWHLRDIRKRVKAVFAKWQEALQMNNAEVAKGYVSDHFYNHCSIELEQLKEKGIREIAEHPHLIDYGVMSIEHKTDETKDVIWVYFKYKETEYKIKKETQELLEGKPRPLQRKELWKFIRENNSWVLDSIRENIKLVDIEALTSIDV